MTTQQKQIAIPGEISLKGGQSVTVRRMTEEDVEALHAFFCRIPAEDLLFLRSDVTNRRRMDAWGRDVASGQTITLLAECEGRVVSEASLHRSRVAWSEHTAQIRVVVDAEHRRTGLGAAMVQAIFLEALELGIEKLIAEMTADQISALNTFQKMGFIVEGLMRRQVRDRTGEKRDLIVMGHEVGAEGDLLSEYGVGDAMGVEA